MKHWMKIVNLTSLVGVLFQVEFKMSNTVRGDFSVVEKTKLQNILG